MAARVFLLSVLIAASLCRADTIPDDKCLPARVAATLASDLYMPTDVAVDAKGSVYVADGTNNRIVRFTAGKPTTVPTEPLNRPVAISLDPAGNLVIADTRNHRILSTSPEGKTLSSLPVPPATTAPSDPTDALVTADGRRTYVVDNDHHRILVHDRDADTWTILGQAGRALGQFQYPFMLAAGTDGDIFVTEAIGARVQILSANDKWAGTIGKWGIELGQFYRPKGIAIDKAGRVFVSDSTTNAIQVFSARGVSQGVLTGDDDTPLRFKHPMGMAFDADGKLYVTELSAHRIAVVELLTNKATTRPAAPPSQPQP